LGNVIVDQTAARFDLNHEPILNKQIGTKMAEQCSVLITHIQRMLLDNCDPSFCKSMRQSILINFFEMTTPQVLVNLKAGLTNQIAQSIDFGKTIRIRIK